MTHKFVRIRSYNKAIGCVTRRYMYDGKRFDCDHVGWYRVSAPIADELAKAATTTTGALIFDVVSKTEAASIEEKEVTEEWSTGRDTIAVSPIVADSEFRSYDEKLRHQANEHTERAPEEESSSEEKPARAKKKAAKKQTRRSQTK